MGVLSHCRPRSSTQNRQVFLNALDRIQAETKAKQKAVIEKTKRLDATKTGKYMMSAWMEERFNNDAKGQTRSFFHQTSTEGTAADLPRFPSEAGPC